MMKHFSRLVDELTANPEAKISELSVVDEEEKKLIIETFNDTATEYPRGKTVVELFEEQVGRTPDHIAVVFEDETMSYAMLNEKANQLAYKLRELGVRPDDRVAILARRSMEMMIGIYGVMKAGGAYVPMDPSYPDNRIQYMLEDCQPKAILLGKAELPFKEDIPVIDLLDPEVYTGEAANPVHVNAPKDLMYTIYTSGTTGKPKGVMIEHRNVVNFIAGMLKRITFVPGRSVLSLTTLSFDIFVLETLLPLAKGMEVILATDDQTTIPDKLAVLLEDTSIDLIQLTPSRLQMLLSSPSMSRHLARVKDILVGGEALSQSLLDRLKAATPARIYNMYGPTETTVWSLVDRLDNCDSLTIGKPIANTSVYVTDADNRMLGIGMPGELCIAGAGLSRGYLNRPELTAEKFVENPFGEDRMYRTGDLARWLPDGNIEFLGRIDEQVKIRGFRIELGEIENVLREIDCIKDAAVIARTDASGDKVIYAYLTSDETIDIRNIRSILMKQLPQYMVPAYMGQVDSIPVTTNGKADKRRLSMVEIVKNPDTTMYMEPKNDKEAAICKAYRDIFNLDEVSTNDTFFELGGDSIKAIRIISKLREYGYIARAREILSNISIIELAGYMEEIDGSVSEQEEINAGVENKQMIEEIVDMDIDSVKFEDKIELPVVLQEDVRAYLHRSMPLCIILANGNYKGWYYSNYIQIFARDDAPGHTFLDYIEPEDSYNDVSEVVTLGYHMFRENEDFVDFVKNKLRLGFYITANVDEMELKNKRTYQREHFVHASLIYGYDDNKRTFQGIGFDESQVFSYLEFDYDEMQRAFTSGKKYYKMGAPWCERSAVKLVRPISQEKKFVFNNRKFLMDLHDYVYSIEDPYRLYTFGYAEEEKIEYGIRTYDVVIERLKEREKTGMYTIDYRAIHLIYEHKQGLYSRIRYLDDIYGLSEEVKTENQKLHELVEETNKVRIKWLSIRYNFESSDNAKVNAVIKELIGDITNLKVKEIPIVTKLYELLEKQLDNKNEKVNPDYFITMR
ncbi:non-ribosomal peptide synthetase [Paenibacillus kobensis]|uniref:non-ribosomal peptide synthetase n=1 Tax=Paenibacillus kobensis TaxID=59841 RepID=UPI000FDCB79E|nr:non-ribosomal peptide synthetase [Paenibacillus kobensis]